MTTVQKNSDRGLRIADFQRRPIRNPKSEIRNRPKDRKALATWNEAVHYLVGGVNSPVRAFRQTEDTPILLARGKGAVVENTAGTRYVDFIGGWGALLLGHNHPAVVQALRQALRERVTMGLTVEAEIELARLIAEAVPSVEQVRFTASGTEACLTAVRLARACTHRDKILVFDGCYHGHGESLMARKTAGLPRTFEEQTRTVAYNDVGAFEEAIRHHGDELACVIIEPVAANMGVVLPESGYLARVRQLTRRHGILLILDEVVTGFRLGWGGAQGLFGLTPDLTTFGKIIGGGLPIGALGGPRRLMQRLAPEGDVYHGGTFAGHPLSMAAGLAALQAIKADPPYQRLAQRVERFATAVVRDAAHVGLVVQFNHIGSMGTLFFSARAVKNFADAKASRRELFARWARALRAEGVLVPPSPFEALFVSAAHTSAQLEQAARAAQRALHTLPPGAGDR